MGMHLPLGTITSTMPTYPHPPAPHLPWPAPCSFVSYLGPFNKEFRELLLARDFHGSCQHLGIPVTKDLQVGQRAGIG